MDVPISPLIIYNAVGHVPYTLDLMLMPAYTLYLTYNN